MLTPDEIRKLAVVNTLDWSNVEPSIFGTLFERILDPDKRSQIGAHYTSRDDIETLLQPVVMQPLRREWDAVQAECEELWPKVQKTGTRRPPQSDRQSFARAEKVRQAAPRLHPPPRRRDDPRSGLRLGQLSLRRPQPAARPREEVISYAAQNGVTLFPPVRPTQLLGIEINDYAQELASVVIWIGYLQWMHDNGFTPQLDPVLEPFESIRRMDAILDLSDPDHPREPEWPAAEFIVGNPPFLGDKKMRAELGNEYRRCTFQTVCRTHSESVRSVLLLV